MKIYDLCDEHGDLCAFEISSLVGRRAAARIAARIPGARCIPQPKVLRERAEGVFCVFQIDGVRFHIWEPYGDNSRFWIGPDPMTQTPHLIAARQTFAAANAWAFFFFALAG